jgi:hypothetical protein
MDNICCGACVSSWHETDVLVAILKVCFAGVSGPIMHQLICLLSATTGRSARNVLGNFAWRDAEDR